MQLEEAVPEAESLFPPMSQSTEGGADRGESDEREKADVVKRDMEPVVEGKDEEKGGGLLDHLISNLVSPVSPKAGEINEVKAEDPDDRNKGSHQPEEDACGSEGGGGLITDITSNFFYESEGEVKQNEEKKEEESVKGVAEEDEKLKAKEDGGDGIMDTIVSHLPISIPDDVAPTTDEAAILIHSIIHD